MHGEGFFYQAFVYLTAAVVSVPVAKRLGLGSVLGYLIAGMIIGPFGLGLIGKEGQDVMNFAEFGVVMMLFLVGLELRPSLLWQLRGPILGLGGLQVGITTAVMAAIGMALGLVWQTAIAVGMIFALSSTAIILQTLSEKGLMMTDGGQSSFAVLLFQDIAVIPMLAFLPLLAASASSHGTVSDGIQGAQHGTTWVEGIPGWAETLVVLGAVSAIVLIGQFLVRPLFRWIASTRLRELFTAAALLLVIGIALLMTKVGLSPALGTFLAGVVLAESEYRHELESDIEPFKGLLLGVFFIAVGASIDFGLITTRPGLMAGLVGALLAVKFLVLFVLGRLFRMGLDQNLLFAFALAQGGEFAFVLFSFATQQGVIAGEVANPLVAVVALSMAVTPVLMVMNEKLLQPRFGTRERPEGEADEIDEQNAAIIAGFGRVGSIVGRFLRANGVSTTVLEYDSDHVELLRRLGLKAFYGDASRYDLLRAAGMEKAKLIILAIDDHEKIVEMVETVRRHAPHLTILARATGRTQAYDLLDAGVDHVYRETFETSLQMGIDALSLLGLRSYHAHRVAKTFRMHDESALRELSKMRHDKKQYITVARQSILDLEQLLLSELEDTGVSRDAGWDTDSLREEFGGTPQKEDAESTKV
jgi:monovalent cation:proton antiporter-2 (CPA2) family protein